jgi:hypothetical protein
MIPKSFDRLVFKHTPSIPRNRAGCAQELLLSVCNLPTTSSYQTLPPSTHISTTQPSTTSTQAYYPHYHHHGRHRAPGTRQPLLLVLLQGSRLWHARLLPGQFALRAMPILRPLRPVCYAATRLRWLVPPHWAGCMYARGPAAQDPPHRSRLEARDSRSMAPSPPFSSNIGTRQEHPRGTLHFTTPEFPHTACLPVTSTRLDWLSACRNRHF